MGEIRKFEEHDWYAYAGAEKFQNGSEPLIYQKELNEGEVELTLIADRVGVQLVLVDNEGGFDTWTGSRTLSPLQAMGEMVAIVKAVEPFTYAPDLAYSLDHPEQNSPFSIFTEHSVF